MLGINNPFMYNDEKWPNILENFFKICLAMFHYHDERVKLDIILYFRASEICILKSANNKTRNKTIKTTTDSQFHKLTIGISTFAFSFFQRKYF